MYMQYTHIINIIHEKAVYVEDCEYQIDDLSEILRSFLSSNCTDIKIIFIHIKYYYMSCIHVHIIFVHIHIIVCIRNYFVHFL